MAIINQDWISDNINACTTIVAYVNSQYDFSTIKGGFYPIIQSTGAPELRPAIIGEPVALVVDKMPDNYDPFYGGYAKSQKNKYMVRIQISGIAAVKYSGSIPTVGSYATLGPDGAGGLKTVDSGGRSYLVVASNTITKQIWIVL